MPGAMAITSVLVFNCSDASRERGSFANLDRRVGLCPRRHRQKEAEAGCLALHFATNYVGHPFREDALTEGLSSRRLHSSREYSSQPEEFIYVLTGQ